MYYGSVKYSSIENGPGVRVSLFVSGCRNNCPFCFSPQTHDFLFGEEFTTEVQDLIVSALRSSYIQGLTILGGEPFEPENQKDVLTFIQRIRSELPDKDIWVYSGFTFEEIYNGDNRACTDTAKEILKNIDVLVDGRFDMEKKDISLAFRGSSNQRLIDVKKTLNDEEVVLFDCFY